MVCTWKEWYFGPYSFEDDDGYRVAVNADRYIEMLHRFFIPALRKKRGFDLDTVFSTGWCSTPLFGLHPSLPPPTLSRRLCNFEKDRQSIATKLPWSYPPGLFPLGLPKGESGWGQSRHNWESHKKTLKEKSGEFQMMFWRGSGAISMSEWQMSFSSQAPGLST